MPRAAAIGVDLGGSWLRVHALDHEARRLFSLKRPAVGIDRLPHVLSALWRERGIRRLPSLAIASRGLWWPNERRALATRVARLARRIAVFSDVEGAWHAAFPGASDRGILVAAGTGSIALAREAAGRMERAGGLGPLLGDEGSAFWIGREWLRQSQSAEDTIRFLRRLRSRPQPVREIARLAHHVQRAAVSGDRTAARIIKSAQSALAALAGELAERTRWSGEIPISWAGGLLEKPAFRKGWIRAVRALEPKRKWRWTPPSADTATAAARYAFTRISGLRLAPRPRSSSVS